MRIKIAPLVIAAGMILMVGSYGGSNSAKAANTNFVVDGNQTIETVFGNGVILPFSIEDFGKPATQVPLSNALHSGMVVGSDRTLYVSMPSKVVKVGSDGIVQPVVGICTSAHPHYPACVNTSTGDGEPALQATVSSDVKGLGLGPDGSLYIADRYRIRRISPDGIIRTVAGGDQDGFSGDGGSALQAKFGAGNFIIADVDVAADGTLYITDTGNNRIRKVDTNGIVTTIAGKSGSPPNCWDIPAVGNATDIFLFYPESLTIGPDNALYVSNYSCAAVRRIANGVSTLLVEGFDDNGDGIATSIDQGNGIAFGVDGTLYLTNYYGNANNVLLARATGDNTTKLTPEHLIAGKVDFGYRFSGDGGPAKNSELAAPSTLASASDGSIYILDALNYRVRRIAPHYSGAISPVAGGTLSTAQGDLAIQFPGGAVSTPTDITLTTAVHPTHPISTYHPTRFFFALTANSGGTIITKFNKTYTLTLTYQDRDLQGITDEARLNLFFWNGEKWQALLPCAGCSLDIAHNRVTLAIDHFSDFALMATSGSTGTYLPIVQR